MVLERKLRREYSRPVRRMRTTAASSSGYGSGASASSLYTPRNAFSEAFDRFVRASISLDAQRKGYDEVHEYYTRYVSVSQSPLIRYEHTSVPLTGNKALYCAGPFRSGLNALGFSSSGNFLNSDVGDFSQCSNWVNWDHASAPFVRSARALRPTRPSF